MILIGSGSIFGWLRKTKWLLKNVFKSCFKIALEASPGAWNLSRNMQQFLIQKVRFISFLQFCSNFLAPKVVVWNRILIKKKIWIRMPIQLIRIVCCLQVFVVSGVRRAAGRPHYRRKSVFGCWLNWSGLFVACRCLLCPVRRAAGRRPRCRSSSWTRLYIQVY